MLSKRSTIWHNSPSNPRLREKIGRGIRRTVKTYCLCGTGGEDALLVAARAEISRLAERKQTVVPASRAMDAREPVVRVAAFEKPPDHRTVMAAPKMRVEVGAPLWLKHYSLRAEESYRHWIERFICYRGNRHRREMGGREVEALLPGSRVGAP